MLSSSTAPDFAMIHGGRDPTTDESLGGIDLYMPRFEVCRDVRLPSVVDAATRRWHHSLATLEEIVYMCGGESEWHCQWFDSETGRGL